MVQNPGGRSRHLKAIIGVGHEDFDDSLRVQIVVRTDKRSRKHIKLGEKRIESLAEDVIKHFDKEDDFTIVTAQGQKITATEIFVHEIMLVDTLGKSVKCQKAWDALDNFYKRLKKSGALEQ
jgi:hypothetical protein